MSSATVEPRSLRLTSAWKYWVDQLVSIALVAATAISVVTSILIVGVLLWESAGFFQRVTVGEFLGDTVWTPKFSNDPRYGIWPLVCGTVLVAVGSAMFAVPLGLMGAIYLSEYSSAGFRNIVKPLLEVLAGIPSVVLGYFALILISPIVRTIFPSAGPFNALSACIAVGVMIIPTVISLSEDVLRSVPKSLREAAYALGSTKSEVTTRVVFPAALSGIMAAIILAISRALGETMVVAIAAGSTPKLTLNPLESIQTMTAFIAATAQGETARGETAYFSLYAVCITLFLMTFTMNIASQYILASFQERYE